MYPVLYSKGLELSNSWLIWYNACLQYFPKSKLSILRGSIRSLFLFNISYKLHVYISYLLVIIRHINYQCWMWPINITWAPTMLLLTARKSWGIATSHVSWAWPSLITSHACLRAKRLHIVIYMHVKIHPIHLSSVIGHWCGTLDISV